MIIRVVRASIRVLLLDPSVFSKPGNLSLANRTRAFYTYLLSILMFNFLFCRVDCVITNNRNFYLFEIIVSNFGRFESPICFSISNIVHPLLINK
jgi:hypothetical protein